MKEPQLGHQRIEGVLKDGNHQNDQQRIDHLNLVGLDGEGGAHHLAVHASRLQCTPAGLLVKECPEDGQWQVEKENGHQGAHVVDGLALKV